MTEAVILSEKIVVAAEALVEAITFDDSGNAGQGGNGGLISRETIRAADELRHLVHAWRRAGLEYPDTTNAGGER